MSKPVVVLVSILLAALTVPASAQGKQACPPVIALLLPKIGVEPTGSFNLAGDMGLGSGVAKIPFSHPCISTTKYPATITLAITYYGGEMAAMLQMQGDAVDEQTMQNATEEMTRATSSLGSKTGATSPVRTESLAGAKVVYYDFQSECPAEGAAGNGPSNRPPIPNVRLKGVARTDNVRMEITLEGQLTTDLALSIVREVVENLKKANFATAAPAGK